MFTFCGQYMVTANSADGDVKIWNRDGKIEKNFEKLHASIIWILCARGNYCVSAGEDRTINGTTYIMAEFF